MKQIPRSQLVEAFEKPLANTSYKVLDRRDNPVHFEYEGEEFYAYIKLLSPAYLKGCPNVWRAQLTNHPLLPEIQRSKATFLLLGYDIDNKVFATWNPYKLKQRIGTAASPSFYSRLSEQKEVSTQQIDFKKLILHNDLEVLIFKPSYMPDFLLHVEEFFLDTSDYVAIGSKRRKGANETYRQFNNIKNIPLFRQYLLQQCTADKADIFARIVQTIIREGLISQHKTAFLQHDTIEEYRKETYTFAKDCAVSLRLDASTVRNALWRYVRFVESILKDSPLSARAQAENAETQQAEQKEEETEQPQEEEKAKKEDGVLVKDGKVVWINDNDMLLLLAPLLGNPDPQERRLSEALKLVGERYASQYPDMTLSDWTNLLTKNGGLIDICRFITQRMNSAKPDANAG